MQARVRVWLGVLEGVVARRLHIHLPASAGETTQPSGWTVLARPARRNSDCEEDEINEPSVKPGELDTPWP